MERVTYYRTETEADYWDLADHLGMRNGKVKTDNFLRSMWEKHGNNTCVKVIEHDDGEITWEVELYKSVAMRGEIVIRHQRNDVKIYHVETQEDCDDLMNKLKKDEYTWIVDENAEMESELWSVYESGTYISTYEHDKMIGYGAIEHLETMHPNEPIIKYKTDKTDKVKELQKYSEQIAKKKEDLVNHPAHYNQYSQEVIDTIEEVTANMPVAIAYHVGNAVKYLFRAPFKGKLKQDLEKAIWYLERAVSKL